MALTYKAFEDNLKSMSAVLGLDGNKILMKAATDIFGIESQKKSVHFMKLADLPKDTLLEDESEVLWLKACEDIEKLKRRQARGRSIAPSPVV